MSENKTMMKATRNESSSFHKTAHAAGFRRAFRVGLCAALAFVLPGTGSLRADVTVSVQDSTPSGSNGRFDVLLTNNGASQIQIGAFNFEVAVGALSGVHFTNATPNPLSNPYIFGTVQFPPFTSAGFPTQDFGASDFNINPALGLVGPGMTVGLGLVSYSVDPGATGLVPFTLVDNGTSVSDFNGPSIPDSLHNGTITLAAPNSTPEPSSALLTAIGAIFLAWKSWRGARRHRVHPRSG
jgi:hypothetical protein